MGKPVKGNTVNNCSGTATSSNDIVWAGGPIPGLCGTANLTQVLSTISQNQVDCCDDGTFPDGHASCFTGNWIDFGSSIPLTGFNSSCSWSIVMSSAFGRPEYKWTREGDLKVRGGFGITITPSTNTGTGGIAMVGLPVTCFPTGWKASQFNVTAVDPLSSTPNATNVFAGGVSLDFPTGILYFGFSYSSITLSTITTAISLGGTTLNLA